MQWAMSKVEHRQEMIKMNHLENFIRNPLGIIALFLSVIYGIAGYVISNGFSFLHGCCERLPLIYFIVFFPVVVLVAFIYLVVKHNEKLYAPKDFDNQDGFLEANGKKIKPNEPDETLVHSEIIPGSPKKSSICMLAYSSIINKEEKWKRSEESALKKYSTDHEIEIQTEISFGRNYVCDGIAQKEDKTYLFEVKSEYSLGNFDIILRRFLALQAILEYNRYENLNFILILISERKIEEDKMNYLYSKAKPIIPNFEIVNYTVDEIKDR